MIPVAQLDPASLTLWFSGEILARAPDAELLEAAAWSSMTGDISSLQELVANAEDDGEKTRAAHVASAVWHEQRHMVDLLLTNYGAFRVRQFLSVYANVSPLLEEARAREALFCPITAYADPVRAAVHGLKADDESGVVRLARDVGTRIAMAHADRQRVPFPPHGDIEVGGEAQLEAIAHISETVALSTYFGQERAEAVQRDVPGGHPPGLRYRWAMFMAARLGLGALVQTGRNARTLNVTQLMAILYGSLATRRWGQEQVRTDRSSSSFAGERLAGFLHALAGRLDHASSTEDAWELVNRTAEELWGRSVVDEMIGDYEHEHHWVETLEEGLGTDHAAARVARDFHELRGGLLTVLTEHPLLILDPLGFALELLPHVRPMPVFASPSGRPAPLEPGEEPVLGYDGGSGEPDDRWCWAWTPAPELLGEEGLRLTRRTEWLHVVSELAPVAKLLMHGRSHRTMLGPEIAKAEAGLETLGISVRVDPLFQAPTEAESTELFFHLSRAESVVCDFCHKEVARDAGALVSPWAFRRSEAVADDIKRRLGGGVVGERRFFRDWSPWIVCDGCLAQLRAAGIV